MSIKDNSVYRFFKKIFILTIIVLVLDKLTGTTLKYFYFRQTAGSAYRTTYSIDSTNAEILVFGSSRANHHYVPEVFEQGLKMTFYNTGRDGNFILYNFAVFKAILKRYTPKTIVLDITPDELLILPGSYDRLASLLPYYDEHPEIQNVVNLRSPYEPIKLLSSVYPFNSTILTIGVGNLEFNKKRKPERKGYIPMEGKMNKQKLLPIPIYEADIDTNKFQALDSIAALCYEKKIKLYICYSPIYSKTNKTKIDSQIINMSEFRKFKYFDFSNDQRFINRPDLFRDINHLNSEGADYYSLLVIDSILFYY